MQVRLHMMCADHPNIVQILEVYANSVQFPHESSPRCVSRVKFSPLFGEFHLNAFFFSFQCLLMTILFRKSEAPDRHGDDGGRRVVP